MSILQKRLDAMKAKVQGDSSPSEATNVVPMVPAAPTTNNDLPSVVAVHKEADETKRYEINKATRDTLDAMPVIVDQHGMVRLVLGAEAVPIESARGFDAIRLGAYDRTGKVPADDTLRREVSMVRAKAQQSGKRTQTFKRIGRTKDGLVIDRGGNRGIYVRAGEWEDRDHDGALFFRGPGYGELPEPIRQESPKAALRALDKIMAVMGVPEIRRLMLIVALVNALRPGVPYVLILLIGGAGSGKTTTAGNLGGFIDPTTSGELPNVPLNAQDIAAVGQEHHAIGIDNISKIEPAGSDLLCVVANGSEFIVREFHTRSETTRLHVHCQVFVTAITNPVTRGDLLDRVIPITLEPHGDYKGEDEVRAWFQKIQPVAVGALLELLAAALGLLPTVKTQRRWTHRLVDFCQLGEAIVQACGEAQGTFLRDFEAMRREAAEEAASGDPVIQHVLDIVHKLAKSAECSDSFPPWRRWSTTGHCAIRAGNAVRVAIKASTLRDSVRTHATAAGGRGWMPESDKQMADVLQQKKPTLAAINIQVTRELFNGGSGAAWVFSWEE